MRAVEEEGYKYLGILEVDMMREKDMKKTICERVQEKAEACVEIKIEWKEQD